MSEALPRIAQVLLVYDRGRVVPTASAGRGRSVLSRLINLLAMRTHIMPITATDERLARLSEEAAQDGFRFVQRLRDDWVSGANRFDQPGEHLVGAISDGELLGIAGFNRDPYVEDSAVGRLRHLYVTKSLRNAGIGSALLAHLLSEASSVFTVVRLRTDNPIAAAFYERRGFTRLCGETASHEKRIRGRIEQANR